jgi:hypothetical protein
MRGIFVHVQLALLLLVVTLAAPQGANGPTSAPPEVSAPLHSTVRKSLPETAGDAEVERALRAGIWNRDKTALAIHLPSPRGTALLVFILQATGGWLTVDVSRVERANLGKLGVPGTAFDSVETAPLRWLDRSDGLLQVEVRTRARKSGQRFTVSEPLLIRPDGTVLWR